MYTDSVDHLPNTLCTYTICEPRCAEPIKSTCHSSEQSTLTFSILLYFIFVCLVSKNSMELTSFLWYLLCLLQFVFQPQVNQLIPWFQTLVMLWTNNILQKHPTMTIKKFQTCWGCNALIYFTDIYICIWWYFMSLYIISKFATGAYHDNCQ